MERAILVTGGAGYIGSHICKALAQKGYLPVTIDNLSLGHQWAVKWGPLVVGNCGDHFLLQEVLKTYQVEGVIHLAALSNVGESFENPLNYYQNNVGETLGLLNEVNVPFVFSSTCAVYGNPEKIPIDEKHKTHPISPYGKSKLMVEEILKGSGLPVAFLRYFNAAGADLEGEIGESHSPETHLIPLLIETALGKRDLFTLNGNDYETKDGTAIRDYIHVTDLAKAHIAALEKLMDGGKSFTVNLGSGAGYSVQEVIGQIRKEFGQEIPIQVGKRRRGDPPILVAKGSNVLRWKPQYSDLSTILQTAYRWHRKMVLA